MTKIVIKNSWDEVTWNEYEQIEQIVNADIPADYKTVHLVALLTGMSTKEVENLPLTQLRKLTPALKFLQKDPTAHNHKFKYNVNGREYIFRGGLDEISTAQYIDYRTYMADEVKDVVKLFSCFLIPEGHDYNDGYDIDQVKADIGDMCWLDVRAAAFFFRIQLAAYTLILKSYLLEELKGTKATKNQKKELSVYLNNLGSSLLSCRSVRQQIPILTL